MQSATRHQASTMQPLFKASYHATLSKTSQVNTVQPLSKDPLESPSKVVLKEGPPWSENFSQGLQCPAELQTYQQLPSIRKCPADNKQEDKTTRLVSLSTAKPQHKDHWCTDSQTYPTG